MAELVTTKRRIPVPFFTAIGATTAVILASDQIPFDYRVTKVEAHFADDCANNLQVWVFTASNNNTGGTTTPPDNRVLGHYSPTPYLIGNGETVSEEVEFKPLENEKYIKVFFNNLNAYQVYGYCIVTIETPEEILGAKLPSAVLKSENAWSLEDWKRKYDKQAQAIYEQAIEFTKGTPNWMDYAQPEYLRANGKTATDYGVLAGKVAAMTSYFTPKMHNDAFIPALQKWFSDANNLMGLYSASDIMGEISGLGFINFASKLVDRDELTWGVGAEMGEINKITYNASINEFARQSANLYFQAMIPDVQELINEVVKEIISLDDFKYNMKLQGVSETWSQRIWDAHYIQPKIEDIIRAIHFGNIDPEERYYWYKLMDLDPRYNEKIWDTMFWRQPEYQELINWRVKEVITQMQFEDRMYMLGYDKRDAGQIWAAHFTPPNVTDFLTAWRRKETVLVPRAGTEGYVHTFGEDEAKDMEVLHELTILADYDPRYQSFFDTRFYNDPTPRLARWAFETGDVDPERIKDIVHRFGYYPEDEGWIADMFIHFQERPWVTRYLTALASAYIAGAITADELKDRVTAIPRNEAIADWMIKIADVRKEIAAAGGAGEKQKLLSVSDLKKAYLYGKIDETRLRTELQLMGYETMDIQTLIDVINAETEAADIGGQKKGLTTTEYIKAWRRNVISESQFRTAMQLKGMADLEIDILMETKRREWGIGEEEGGESAG